MSAVICYAAIVVLSVATIVHAQLLPNGNKDLTVVSKRPQPVVAVTLQTPQRSVDARVESHQEQAVRTVATPPASKATTYSSICQPGAYMLPAMLAPSSAPVAVVKDAPSYYVASARGDQTLAADVTQCSRQIGALRGYAAITSYNMGWSFTSQSLDNQMCRLDDIHVTMHINQYFPTLDESSAARTSNWSQAASRLYAHENQHAALDEQYAHLLAAELGAIAGPCASIMEAGQQHATTLSAALKTANANLDTATNHGLF